MVFPTFFNLSLNLAIRISFSESRRNINNLRYTDDTILMAESKEELKRTVDESERGE